MTELLPKRKIFTCVRELRIIGNVSLFTCDRLYFVTMMVYGWFIDLFDLSLSLSKSQGHIKVVIMMMTMKCQFHWWRKPEL